MYMGKQNSTHAYRVIYLGNGRYQAVMILSEHDNYKDAFEATMTAMNKESEEVSRLETVELRAQGFDVVTLEEAIQGMTPEELAQFNEERNRKFVNPILNGNIERLEKEQSGLKIK